MAGIKITGMDELRRNTVALSKAIEQEAVQAAREAAARVVRSAVAAAAPRQSGGLAGSVGVFKSWDRRALTTTRTERLLVGPDKRRGYYGFFLEKGWTATGSARRERTATGTTHGQKGVTGGRKVPPRPWMEPITAQVEQQAFEAGRAAFEAVINRMTK